jgi:hypothetical protein
MKKYCYLSFYGLYSQHFIFYVSYKWAQEASVPLNQAEKLSRDKHISFLGPSLSYKENEVL